jgi:glycosyltransferase involved in cell wall biosynthesis
MHACNDVHVWQSAGSLEAAADDPAAGPQATTRAGGEIQPVALERPGSCGKVRTARGERRLLVVSHPAVVNVNQEVYRELVRREWKVTIVLPSRWRHEYSHKPVRPQALAGMESSLRPTTIVFPGRVQRHIYLTRCRSLCRSIDPHVAFLEAEPYALAATQWSHALTRLNIPFGVQCYENIDRGLPAPIRWLRTRVLHNAAFVAARSDSAARLAHTWGARGEVGFAPPAVPSWSSVPTVPAHPFTVGYAGRLIERKGLLDLLAAVRRLDAPVELLMIGNGELRHQLEGQTIPGSHLRVLDDLTHDQMASGYAQLDVLVVPSHTTATWKEQFGRVIVEALWCGVPIVGSSSGEIPWLIELTGGGLVFAEGDISALADALRNLREHPELRRELAETGRAAVERLFSVPAATDRLEQMLIGASESARD